MSRDREAKRLMAERGIPYVMALRLVREARAARQAEAEPPADEPEEEP